MSYDDIQPNRLSVLNVHVLVYMWCTLIDRHYLFNAIKITEDTCIYRSGLYRGSLKRSSNGFFLMSTLRLFLLLFFFFAMEALLQNFTKIASFRKIQIYGILNNKIAILVWLSFVPLLLYYSVYCAQSVIKILLANTSYIKCTQFNECDISSF